jgi:hypothetical protein
LGAGGGRVERQAEVPEAAPITPKDLTATVFHVLGIDPQVQVNDPSGRPTYLLPEGTRPVAELV